MLQPHVKHILRSSVGIFAALLVGACATTATEPLLSNTTNDNLSAQDWFERANELAENDRLEEAEHAYREAIGRGMGAKALHNLGLVQVWLGVQALREARGDLPPDDPVHAETRAYLEALLSGLR